MKLCLKYSRLFFRTRCIMNDSVRRIFHGVYFFYLLISFLGKLILNPVSSPIHTEVLYICGVNGI